MPTALQKLGWWLRRLRPQALRRTATWVLGLVRELRRRRAEARLTIAVDVNPYWEPLTGVGTYLDRLLRALASRSDVALRLYGPDFINADPDPPASPLPTGPSIEHVVIPVPHDLTLPPGLALRALRKLSPWLLALDQNDVLFAPNYLLARRFALSTGARVAMIHDLVVKSFPEATRPDTRRALADRLDRVIATSDRLLTPSRTVRRELLADGVPPGRVVAIPHGADHLDEITIAPLPDGVAPPFALFVGTIEPRKDVATLLDAWRLLQAQDVQLPRLVLAGGIGWRSEALAHQIEDAVEESWLTHLGYVGDAVLVALYRSAAMVLLPSRYEGFGLTVAEGMRAGAPVILSDIPVLREVGGDAALYAPVGDAPSWAAAIRRLLTDRALATRLIESGRKRASMFRWETTAERTLEVWRRVAGD